MKCVHYNGRTEQKKVTKHHWLDGRLYVVENVDAQVCTECGERYFHAKTLDAIDGTLRRKHRVKEKLAVEVVSL